MTIDLYILWLYAIDPENFQENIKKISLPLEESIKQANKGHVVSRKTLIKDYLFRKNHKKKIPTELAEFVSLFQNDSLISELKTGSNLKKKGRRGRHANEKIFRDISLTLQVHRRIKALSPNAALTKNSIYTDVVNEFNSSADNKKNWGVLTKDILRKRYEFFQVPLNCIDEMKSEFYKKNIHPVDYEMELINLLLP